MSKKLSLTNSKRHIACSTFCALRYIWRLIFLLPALALYLPHYPVFHDFPVKHRNAGNAGLLKLVRHYQVKGLVCLGVHDIRRIAMNRKNLRSLLLYDWNLNVIMGRHDDDTALAIHDAHALNAHLLMAVLARPGNVYVPNLAGSALNHYVAANLKLVATDCLGNHTAHLMTFLEKRLTKNWHFNI